MKTEPPRQIKLVAVTGASGYIGARICRLFLEQGVAVRALSRRDPQIAGADFRLYDLRRDLQPAVLAGMDAVIHAASETARGADVDIEAELEGLRQLLNAAESASARFVFISSQSAAPDAPTAYGRLKAKAEDMVLMRGGIVVRPGQVFGGEEKGLWKTLATLARRSPVVPRFVPEPTVQPIHVDDLAKALFLIALDPGVRSRVYALADPRPISFSRFIQLIAACRYGRLPVRVLIPMAPLIWGIRAAALLGLKPSFTSRLASLRSLRALRTEEDMASLGLEYRAFPDGVGRKNRYEAALIREGNILLHYATGKKSGRWLIRRYVRAVPALGAEHPLELAGIIRCWPGSLTLFDQRAARERAGPADVLSQRIDLALLIAESSPAHVSDFLPLEPLPGRLAQMARLAFFLPLEGVARLADAAAGKWIDRSAAYARWQAHAC